MWLVDPDRLVYPFIFAFGFAPLFLVEFVSFSTEGRTVVEVVHGCLVDLISPLLTSILFSLYRYAAGRKTPEVLNERVDENDLFQLPFDNERQDDNLLSPPLTT